MLVALALGSALVAPIAYAQTYVPAATTAVFSGPVTVQKDLGTYNCTLNVSVVTGTNAAPDAHGSWSHAHSATATANLTGSWPCPDIEVNGTATVNAYTSGSDTIVELNGLSIVPPISFGICRGSIKAVWGGNGASPRNVTVSSPLSNVNPTLGAACKLNGTLSQTSGTPLEVYP